MSASSKKKVSSIKPRKVVPSKHKSVLRRKKVPRDQKITISFGRFVEFVQIRHHYFVVSVIVEHPSGHVKFIECKSPLRQKSFFVYINPDYIMVAPEEKFIKMRVKLLPKEEPSPRRAQFLKSMKGTNISGDLLFIASDMVYMGVESGEVRCYSVKGDEDEEVLSIETNKVKKVRTDLKKIMKRIGITSKKLVDDEGEEELEFHDEDGEPFDRIKNLMTAQTGTISDIVEDQDKVVEIVQPPIEPLKEDVVTEGEEPLTEGEAVITEGEDVLALTEEDIKSEDVVTEGEEPLTEGEDVLTEDVKSEGEEPLTEGEEILSEDEPLTEEEEGSDYDNELPDIESEEVVLGMVFILVDIRMFFNKIELFENELIEYHNLLDVNETSTRTGRLEDIERMATNLSSSSKSCITKLMQREAEIKADIATMSAVILKIASVKNSVEKNPEKYRSDVIKDMEELSELYTSSRNEVNDCNVKLLKIRDTIDDMLYNFLTHLEKAESVCRKYE